MKLTRQLLRSVLAVPLTAGALIGAEVEKGVSEAPSSAAVVAGAYFRGGGRGHDVTLILNTNGSYLARGQRLGNLGDASGTWELAGHTIVLSPAQETGSLKGNLKRLEVQKFKGNWILVQPDHPLYGKLYEQHGATRISCFFRQRGDLTAVEQHRERDPEALKEHQDWVIECLNDFKQIKPGMTRGEIGKALPLDGGLQGLSAVRFTHPDCPYFKVDVAFSLQRNTNDQNRAIFSPDDQALGISKPYLETPFFD